MSHLCGGTVPSLYTYSDGGVDISFGDSLTFEDHKSPHVRVLYGRDPHHITEAQYKAVARALRQAVEADPRVSGVPSTKGVL